MTWHLPPAVTSSAIGVAVIGGALSILALIIRVIGPWRKQLDDLEERMRKELRRENRRCEVRLSLVRHRERGTRQLIYSSLRLFDQSAAKRKPLIEEAYSQLAAIEKSEAEEEAEIERVLALEEGKE